MLIREVVTESKIEEKAPTGLIKQGWNKLKGALGSAKGKAGADVGTRANEIYKNFRDWGLRSGVDMKAAPVTDLQQWFKTQNLIFPQQFAKAKFVNLTDKTVSSKFWTAAAQSAYKQGASQGDLGSTYGLGGGQAGAQAGAQAGQAQNAQPAAGVNVQSVARDLSSIIPSLSDAEKNALRKILA